MRYRALSSSEWWKAIGIGVLTSILLSVIMVPATLSGISPMPQPLGLAFAETVLGTNLPLPVGLLFHLGWVTTVSVLFVALFRERLTLLNAAWLGLALWVLVLVFFFPIVGWGFLGLGVSPALIVASFVPHLLFAVFLWGLCRLIFGEPSMAGDDMQSVQQSG